MFTGIVEEMGTIRQIKKGRASAVLTIGAKKVLEDAHIGDSIAVNGICLTVTSLGGDSFTADVMHETLRRTALSRLAPGVRVNLERAMAADGRFGGHIVAGHVDGVGKTCAGMTMPSGIPSVQTRRSSAISWRRVPLPLTGSA